VPTSPWHAGGSERSGWADRRSRRVAAGFVGACAAVENCSETGRPRRYAHELRAIAHACGLGGRTTLPCPTLARSAPGQAWLCAKKGSKVGQMAKVRNCKYKGFSITTQSWEVRSPSGEIQGFGASFAIESGGNEDAWQQFLSPQFCSETDASQGALRAARAAIDLRPHRHPPPSHSSWMLDAANLPVERRKTSK
jgi:hypothetical protein